VSKTRELLIFLFFSFLSVVIGVWILLATGVPTFEFRASLFLFFLMLFETVVHFRRLRREMKKKVSVAAPAPSVRKRQRLDDDDSERRKPLTGGRRELRNVA
jgi:hypothetical protein